MGHRTKVFVEALEQLEDFQIVVAEASSEGACACLEAGTDLAGTVLEVMSHQKVAEPPPGVVAQPDMEEKRLER